MQAVMMVAGKSTRTYPLTLTRPKPLLPILNRPLIYFNLDQLEGLVSEVILIVGYRKGQIFNLLGREYKGMKIFYQEQKQQLGTGHAVLQAKPYIKNQFLVLNGDDLFAREDINNLLPFKYAALSLEVPNPSLYGVFKLNNNNQIIKLVEKPKENIGNMANVGCYLFQPEIFEVLQQTKPSERGEIEVTSAIQTIARQEPVQVIPLTKYWLPTGYPWDLLKTQNFLFKNRFTGTVDGDIKDGVTIRGEVKTAAGSVIRQETIIDGPVFIDQNCEIGETCHIGPFVSIGAGVKIAPGCKIKDSILMDNCEIGGNSIIQQSVIGSNVTLGEYCHLISQNPDGQEIFSDIKGKMINTHLKKLGATLSDNVIIEKRTEIYPGCKIWPDIRVSGGTTVTEDIKSQ